jgi:sugar O-acyltransferase (sialic acid O-acetyltransferase NeuD family)
MDNKIILYGASGHCKVIIDILQRNNQKIDAIIDDNPDCNVILGLDVIRPESLDFSNDFQMILSIGNNKIRKKIANNLKQTQFATAIHPQAILSGYASVNAGTVVMGGAVINAGVSIGRHTIVNTGSVIEHDCVIGDFAHISPNASLAGGVTVGEGTQVGIGACVIQNVKIGNWALIGAGAVVINDVPDYAVVVGNPARIIKINENE